MLPCSTLSILIELDGEDLRSSPIQDGKRVLAHLLPRKRDVIILNEHYEGDGPIIYQAQAPIDPPLPAAWLGTFFLTLHRRERLCQAPGGQARSRLKLRERPVPTFL